jgi:hypothetical protein
MKRRAYSAAVASDLNAVRVAAFNYFADHATYPPDGASGIPPAALVPYLPPNVAFSGPRSPPRAEFAADCTGWARCPPSSGDSAPRAGR